MWGRKREKFDFRNPKIYRTTAKEVTMTINPIIIWVILLLVLISLSIYWLFYSNFFKIKNITVEGTLNDSIKNKINDFYGKNIFLFSIGKLDKQLAQQQTSIEKLNIIKGIPDTLKIEVLVRKPEIRWKTEDKSYFIDKDGTVFSLETTKEEDNQLPQVIDGRNLDVQMGSKIITSDFVEFIKKITSELPAKIGKEIEEIKVDETTIHVEVKLKNSYKIYFDTMSDFSDQLYLLQKVVEKHDKDIKDYVDLRIEHKAYYK